MKRKLRGLQRRALDLDFDLYRVAIPIRGLRKAELSVIDMEPEGAEHCLVFVHGSPAASRPGKHRSEPSRAATALLCQICAAMDKAMRPIPAIPWTNWSKTWKLS